MTSPLRASACLIAIFTWLSASFTDLLATDAFTLTPALSADGWAISWSGQPGKIHRVTRSVDLLNWTLAPEGSAPNQQALVGNASGGPLTYLDSSPPTGTRAYYRVEVSNGSPDFVLIPGGVFQMGDNYSEDSADQLPVHAVQVDSFYMEKFEVTKAQWDEVRTWALLNGYAFSNPGQGKATNHPVHSVSWYDCVKWCNARSEMAGLIPAYYTDAALTSVYRVGNINLVEANVNWSGSGFRLPTEAEWEKAARGGVAGLRYPWSDNITHTRANYFSLSYYPYDTSLTRDYHPTYSTGAEPYTSPVGSFDANAYGIFDTVGNLSEWIWDWFGSTYYASSPSANPRGPATGAFRGLRGGSWLGWADDARNANRLRTLPTGTQTNNGLRCVRK